MLDTWNKCCKTAKYDECNNYYRPRSSRDKLPAFSTKPIRFLGPAHFFTFFLFQLLNHFFRTMNKRYKGKSSKQSQYCRQQSQIRDTNDKGCYSERNSKSLRGWIKI